MNATLVDRATYRIVIAQSDHLLLEASQLVAERYKWRGYSVEKSRTTDVTYCAIDNKTSKILATATLRTARDVTDLYCHVAFRSETTRHAALPGMRCAGEITRLATAGHKIHAVGCLLHVIALNAEALDVTSLFAEVNPRHVRFYRDMLGFQVIGRLRECKRASAPAVLVHALMHDIKHRLNKPKTGIYVFSLNSSEEKEVRLFFELEGAQVP